MNAVQTTALLIYPIFFGQPKQKPQSYLIIEQPYAERYVFIDCVSIKKLELCFFFLPPKYRRK
jgi:hypothetical protein